MSPFASCHFAAVSGCTSTHACQVIFETGSGSSCSHGLLAPRPSCNASDGKTISSDSLVAPDPAPATSPSSCAIPGSSRTGWVDAAAVSSQYDEKLTLKPTLPSACEKPAGSV